jgi:hypothetical protein
MACCVFICLKRNVSEIVPPSVFDPGNFAEISRIGQKVGFPSNKMEDTSGMEASPMMTVVEPVCFGGIQPDNKSACAVYTQKG